MIFVLIGLLVVVALLVVGCVGVLAVSSSGSPAGSLSVSPSTINCSAGSPVTMTVTLPSSISGDARVITTIDGKGWVSLVVSSQFTKQSDGTWLHSGSTSLDTCQGPDGKLSSGSHKLAITDSSGKVLAEGTFTINP